MTSFTATYSPEDNKLRLYASSRLDADTYTRVKAAGFKWAPKQGLFVAPMWTPGRVDLLQELAGEIGDEDTSLVDRAAERAERFDGYQERRRGDAQSAYDAAGELAQRFDGGQPILVGHHSEKRARKDQERITGNMRKALKMWETASYWQQRAAGAIRHAKYKELPGVRARRIRTIEADQRKAQRNKADAERKLAAWTSAALTLEQARALANVAWFYVAETDGQRWTAWDVLRPEGERYKACPAMTVEQVQERARALYAGYLPKVERWIEHYEHRLAYERAMLAAAGASSLLDPKPRRELAPLLNYRAPGGSITIANPYGGREPMTYPQVDMTKADYAKIGSDYRGGRLGPDRAHRFRVAVLPGHKRVCVFLTDSKEHPAPSSTTPPPAPEPPPPAARAPRPAPAPDPQAAKFAALKDQLRAGVQVVVAPQLFPTPAALGDRAAELLELEPERLRILEPSAGAGDLLAALVRTGVNFGAVVAVEINGALCQALRAGYPGAVIRQADFLELEPAELGTFDRVLMNPPFENAADIRHIEHARRFLKPGGRLVAICANGPRQERALRPLASSWEALPAGTFKSSGTMVNAALLVIEAPAEAPAEASAELEPARRQLALL